MAKQPIMCLARLCDALTYESTGVIAARLSGGEPIVVYGSLLYGSSHSISDGTKVVAGFLDGAWEVISEELSASE